MVLGSTSDLLEVRHMTLGQGQFLPAGDIHSSESVCVLGAKIRRELFGQQQAIGAWVRLGDRRFRVIGVMASQGESMGFNTDELVIVPVASAHLLFNTSGLFRILVEAKSRDAIAPAQRDAEQILMQPPQRRARCDRDHPGCRAGHLRPCPERADAGGRRYRRDQPRGGGDPDHERDADRRLAAHQEIGLLKALGAPAAQIRNLFFAEAILLSGIGSVVGLILGEAGSSGDRPDLSHPAGGCAMVGGAGRPWHGAGSPASCSACGRRGAPPGSTR